MARLLSTVRVRIGTLRDTLSGSLWPIPAFATVLAVVAGFVLVRLPPAIGNAISFSGGADSARSVLVAVAGSLVTVTSLTFSLTVVTLQLASSQFSNRLLRTFIRDRVVQGTLALFLATFAYTLTVLRTIRSSDGAGGEFVPQVAVTVGYGLALMSLGGLVVFLSHLVTLLRVESMLKDVHTDTSAAIARRTARADADERPPPPVVPDHAAPLVVDRSGFVTAVDGPQLRRAATAHGAVVLLDRAPGDPVVAGTPVGAVWAIDPADGDLDVEALTADAIAAVAVSHERTLIQDSAYGLRQLADVSSKALSPGVNDPTTAIHALGQLSALLCQLADRDMRPRVLTDEEGVVRAVIRRRDFGELLEIGCGEARRYGAGEPRVMARLLRLLREVAWVAHDDEQRRSVRQHLHQTQDALDREIADARDRENLRRLEGQVEEALAGRWPQSVGSDG